MNKNKYGPWVIVTGASSGIGKAFVEKIAAMGFNLIIVARNEDKLHQLKNSLIKHFQIGIKVLIADLTTEEGIHHVIKQTEALEVGLLINNAGREDSNHFLEINKKDHTQTIDLNIKAPLLLAHHFGTKMANRKRGGIINMSSIVAFQGVPYISNYAATKSYNLIFSEGLSAEFSKHNIDVLAVTPGFTATNLASVYDFKGTPFKPLEPSFVVTEALNALGKKRVVIPGGINKFLFLSGKFLFSRKLNTTSFGMVFKKVLRKIL
ncbi:SDR family oxidoreductase [uncultured Algibacter sp.]|uniref:SDR family NAD(P)-dependent oxidoreductase n=1 Tax=uncultured Algibacter sp. TaxID=298659 RepID=UPI00262D9BE7|nr:SDR family NAD(P)-dependent oxidoreductase [uncultured Algibacter sp.]